MVEETTRKDIDVRWWNGQTGRNVPNRQLRLLLFLLQFPPDDGLGLFHTLELCLDESTLLLGQDLGVGPRRHDVDDDA